MLRTMPLASQLVISYVSVANLTYVSHASFSSLARKLRYMSSLESVSPSLPTRYAPVVDEYRTTVLSAPDVICSLSIIGWTASPPLLRCPGDMMSLVAEPIEFRGEESVVLLEPCDRVRSTFRLVALVLDMLLNAFVSIS